MNEFELTTIDPMPSKIFTSKNHITHIQSKWTTHKCLSQTNQQKLIAKAIKVQYKGCPNWVISHLLAASTSLTISDN